MRRCFICNCELEPQDARTALDEVYCEECFSDQFNYCNRCDELLTRDETLWDSDGNPYCSSCYENEHDDDCPDNPPVYDSDRKHILQLSRDWLSGRCNHKSPIKINQADFHLQKLRDMVGLIDTTIYVYGLIDREEYQITASPNILDQVKEFVMLNGLNVTISEGIGCNRLGISYSLRKDNLPLICSLIKEITTVKELI